MKGEIRSLDYGSCSFIIHAWALKEVYGNPTWPKANAAHP